MDDIDGRFPGLRFIAGGSAFPERVSDPVAVYRAPTHRLQLRGQLRLGSRRNGDRPAFPFSAIAAPSMGTLTHYRKRCQFVAMKEGGVVGDEQRPIAEIEKLLIFRAPTCRIA